MDDIVRISSSAPWEPIFGYSRAVRAGDWVSVSGSTGLDEHGQLVGYGQMDVQAHQAMFGAAPPASTLVQVTRLVHPDMLVEIEADAYAGPATTTAARPTAAV